jgi:hypothetical protein
MLITQLKAKEAITSLTAGKKVSLSTVMDVKKFVFRKKRLPDFRRNLLLKEM